MAAEALKAGARVGPYELVAPIGAGGMGEVWKARDTRLDRTVAIKFSQTQFNERFGREARAIAALNHPNIAQIHDVGENYIVMEFVTGEPVRAPGNTRKLLDIAVQIADGLAAAHAAGFIHRDLKPDNILLTREGRVKILDFGLAKQISATSPEEATRTIAVTNPGTVLGTVAYMSPEQARGHELDARSDQFAFGLILYELATGKRAFQRASAAETMTAIIREEPDPIPPGVPVPLRWTIERCMAKDPADRYDTTRGLYLELRTIRERLTEASGTAIAQPVPSRRRPLNPALLLAAAVLSFAGLLALAWVHFREVPPAASAILRFDFSPPGGVWPASTFAISPDGRRVAYFAQDNDHVSRVWLYDLRSAESHPVPGTEKMAGAPVSFSRDGRFLLVQVGTALKRFDLSGGVPSVLTDVRIAVGTTWNGEETILFGSGGTGPIQRLSTRDGSVMPVTKLVPEQGFTGDLMPRFLPDAKHFLYLRRSNVPENYGAYVGSIEAAPERQDTRQVVATKLGAMYVPVEGTAAKSGRGFLIFQREHTLFAQPFDASRLRPTAEPIRLVEGVGYRLDSGFFDATPEILIYRGDPDQMYQLTWFDAGGKPVGVLGEEGGYTTAIGAVAISPDGKRAAVSRLDGGSRDLWVVDFTRGTSARLTFGGADRTAVWSPDGTQVAFRSNRSGGPGIYKKAADGSGEEEKLIASTQTMNPTSWSPDGRFLLYDVRQENAGAFDMWILPLADRKPRRLLATAYDEGQGVFSPDGRWIAYVSNESGRNEVYVTAFRQDGSIKGKWLVSRGALAWTPHWRADSKELEYVGADSSLMSVTISPGETFQAGPPSAYGKAPGRTYGTFAPDGKRLLVPMAAGKLEAAKFTAVLHWQSGLK